MAVAEPFVPRARVRPLSRVRSVRRSGRRTRRSNRVGLLAFGADGVCVTAQLPLRLDPELGLLQTGETEGEA